jgi:hypothetical protein
MATTVNGTNYAKAIDPSSANILGPGIWGGRVRAQFDSYTFAATAVATTVRMAKLPKGAKVIGVIVSCAALGTAVTLAIGNAGSGKSAAIAAAFSASSAIDNALKMLNTSAMYEVGTLSDDDVITVLTAGDPATGLLNLTTLYVMD